MEQYDLPTLDGLHLVQGLCDGVNLGKDALAGFPSLTTIRHQGMLGYHSVNVFNADSRNKSMILHLQNQQEGRTAEELAHQLLNTKAFVGWPFLQEGLVIAVSTPQHKFTKSGKSIQTSHQSDAASHQWHRKAESMGQMYSKRFGVIVGDVELMVHAKPLKGGFIFVCSIQLAELIARSSPYRRRRAGQGLRRFRDGHRRTARADAGSI